MKTTEKYVHHGAKVSVFSAWKGQHRGFCLCHNQCKFFKPGTPENCPLAQELYEYDVRNGMVTPVMECPKYEV